MTVEGSDTRFDHSSNAADALNCPVLQEPEDVVDYLVVGGGGS